MIWVILTALAAVCGAAKLDASHLPPLSARTAGGSAGTLLAPLGGSQGLPTGSYTNDAQGVVVDAVNPGTRTSGLEPTGLGGPRTSYGSKDSKVGDAAFGFSGSISPGLTRIAPGFGSFIESDERQGDKANGNSLKFASDIGLENFSNGFQTDNGISIGENGEAAGGGLPTSPNVILTSLEKNAKDQAAGHINSGSYGPQKHNDEGDYSSNSAGNNNARPTIGGGDATSSGSYVSQSGQRPTSGILVGSYTPGAVGSLSSSSGNKQPGFGIDQNLGGSQGLAISGGSSFGQAGSKLSPDQINSQTGSTHSTENRFGVQATKSEGSHAHAHVSAGSPVRSPNFHSGVSAYSSAVTTGSGSASAFASTGPLDSGLKKEYLPPLSSFGSAGQHTHGSISGSDSSAGASFPAPSTATASASVTGSQTLQSHSNLPSSASASASITGQQHSYEHSNQQVPSRFGEGQQAGNSEATFAFSTQKPFISQPQGPDNSYYYKKPSKPFTTPSVITSGQYSINRQPNAPVSSISQQGSKYPNTPATVATGQYQGTSSSSYNGITQASISPFPSSSSSSSSQFTSQSSQFGLKPSTQIDQTSQQTSTQFGATENHSGHKVQGQTQFIQSGLQPPTQFGSSETHSGHQTQTEFGQSSTSQTSDSSKSPTQQYQGTIYQYNKPVTSLSGNEVQGQTQSVQTGLQVPTQSGSTETHFGHQTSQTSDSSQSPTQQYHGTIYQYNKPAIVTSGKPGQIETGSRFGSQQSSSQSGSQSTFQHTQAGLNVQTSQFSEKPVVTSQVSGSNNQFGNFGSQHVQKPVTTQGSIVSSNSNSQGLALSVQKPIVSSQIGSKPQTTQGSSFTYSQSQSQFGKKPISTIQTGVTSQQTQFGPSSQFGQNSQSTFGSGSVSTTAKPFGSSYQQNQFGSKPSTTQDSSFTYTQFENKPVVSSTQTGTQFGSGSQLGQNSQSSFGSGSVSTTAKPFGSTYQQNQLGSKPSTNQGSSFTYTQSQFEKKPVISTTQTGTQFGSGSQFGQNSQSTFGAGSVSTTAKPFGFSYQQNQFGSKPSTTQGSSFSYTQSQFEKKPVVSTTQTGTQFGSGSQFGQNSQSTFGSGSVPTTAKPFGSSYQQNQFGSKPSTNQGSSFTYTQSQFEKKPVISTTQTGTQFGSGSQFGQNSQSTFGAGSVSTTAKPFGFSYQQNQFGSKPSTTQGSSFTYTQSQFEKKPVVSTTQTGTQFGSGSQFGQNSQSTFGSGLVSTTAKPFGSSYQQNQFGSKPSTTQGSSYTYTQSQFEKKPVISTTQTGTQFGSGSQFGQNSQSTFGAGSVSTTAKPFGSSYQQNQFGSKPSTTQGSSFTYTQSQFEKKPVVSTTQTGTQFGSGSQFGQNSQSTFGSGSVSTTAKPFGSSYQQNQLGSKPSTTQGSSLTFTQSQFEKKPVVGSTQTGTQFGSVSQFGQNSQSSSGFVSVLPAVKPTQQPTGTIYQYNKPATILPVQEQKYTSSVAQATATSGKPGQIETDSRFGSQQSSSQTGSQSTFQQTQTGLNVQTSQFSQKPVVSSQVSGSSYQFGNSGSQFVQKPVTTQSSIVSLNTNTQSVASSVQKPIASSQFGSKPQTSQGSSFTYSQSQSQFGKKPTSATQTGVTSQQTQLGSGLQFGQNSQSTFGAGSVSTTAKPLGSSYQLTQFGSKPSTSQGSSFTQYEKKPVISSTQTGTKFGSGSQFGQNSQSTFGSGSVSTTAKPFGSSYQQNQFGSKPSTSQGSSFTYTQYEKKPVISSTQTGTKFGSGSQFGLNSQSSFGSGSVSTTAKPFGSSYQQNQFQSGSKPSTNQGSSFTYTQSQFEKKPVVSTTQTGTQFGSGSQFGQNSQSSSGFVSASPTVKPTQQPTGTIYQYNKPATTLPVQEQKYTSTFAQATATSGKPGQIDTNSRFGSQQSSSQSGSQSTFQQTQTGSNVQTSQFGQKPVVSSQVSGSSYQFGNSGSQFVQKPVTTQGSIVSSNLNTQGLASSVQKPIVSSQIGSKPQTTQGSSFTYSQSQSQFGKKPISTIQTGVTSQQTQFGSSSQFGESSQSTFGSGSVSTTSKPFDSSYQQNQFGSKPSTSQGSSFTYTQFEKKPVISSTQTGTQFGSGSQFGQDSQSTFGSGLVSTTAKPFGSSYQQNQVGSKPSTTQGSSFTYTQSQYEKKPVVSTTQTGTQFVSGSQFGQNSQSTFGSGSVSTTSKPFGSSYQQNQFGSKPSTSQGSSFTYTQFEKKPVISSTQTGTKFGSGSQFGQNSQSTFGSGSVSTTSKPFGSSYQQNQFGSKPSTTQGSSFTYTQFEKKPVISSTQTGTQFGSGSQFGQNSQSTFESGLVSTTAKPFGTSYQQNQVGSKPSTTQGSSFTYTQSQFEKKPIVSTTQTGTQFGSGSQFGQNSQSSFGSGSFSTTAKPFGSSYQQTGSKFSQNVQSSVGAGSVSSTVKPSIGSSYQYTQFGSKPQTTQGSSFTYSQGSSQTYQSGIKPVSTTNIAVTSQQTTSGSSGFQFGQNSQSTQGSAIALTTSKPVVAIKPVYQQAQFGSSGSQIDQNSQSSQSFGSVSTTAKPAFAQTSFGPVETTVTGVTSTTGQISIYQKPSNTGSYSQQSQFKPTDTQVVQKPQSETQGSFSSSNTGSAGQAVQTSQFGITGSSQNTGDSSQGTQYGSGSSNKVSGSSSATGSSFQTTQTTQTSQYGIKPFDSAQSTQGSTQVSSTPSRFGESSQTIVPISTISQIVEPTEFGLKPTQTQFGSSTTQFDKKPNAYAFASSSGSNVAPFSSTQTGQVSKYETSQFGVPNQGAVLSSQKPVGSSLSQTNYQKYQYTQTTDKSGSQSQFGQGSQSNVGSGLIGLTAFGAQSQKPFGSQSTQTAYQQTHFTQGQKPFGSSQGSAFQVGQTSGRQPSQGHSQTTIVTGYNYQKPQSVFTTQYGSQSNDAQDQKVQQSQSNFNSAVSTSQTPINGQPLKPLGVSSTQGTFLQSQSTVGSSEFGAQTAKPTDFSGPVIQTSFNQFSGKPFQPSISTVSTQGSNVQSQSSAVSTSQFGVPTPSTEIAHFSGQPEFSIIPSNGVAYNPNVFSSTQASSKTGSNEGPVVSTVQTPIVPVLGYELVINQGASTNQGASHSFVGLGEEFGGPRDPPRFDDKTGYHY